MRVALLTLGTRGDVQPYAELGKASKCSPIPVPLKKMNEKILFENVSELLSSSDLRKNCRTLSTQLQSENGLLNAVEIVEARFDRSNTRVHSS